VTQVSEYLLSKCKALSSNPSTATKKKKKKKERKKEHLISWGRKVLVLPFLIIFLNSEKKSH
jgi:hypothetical protein